MIVMATLQQIAPTKSHFQAYHQDAETITLVDVIDPHLGVTNIIGITTMTIEIGTGSADLDLIPIILDIGVPVAVTQAHTITAKTHYTTDPNHTGVSPEMTIDLEHAHPANIITKPQKDHLPVHIKHHGSPRA